MPSPKVNFKLKNLKSSEIARVGKPISSTGQNILDDKQSAAIVGNDPKLVRKWQMPNSFLPKEAVIAMLQAAYRASQGAIGMPFNQVIQESPRKPPNPQMPELHQTQNLNPGTAAIYQGLVQQGGMYGPPAPEPATLLNNMGGPPTHEYDTLWGGGEGQPIKPGERGTVSDNSGVGYSPTQARNNAIYGKPRSPGFKQ